MIRAQTRVAGVSVSQVAQRYDVNTNLEQAEADIAAAQTVGGAGLAAVIEFQIVGGQDRVPHLLELVREQSVRRHGQRGCRLLASV